MTFRDPVAAAEEMCRSLEERISAKEAALADFKRQLARAEEQIEHFRLIRPMGSVVVAAVLGMLLGILTPYLLR